MKKTPSVGTNSHSLSFLESLDDLKSSHERMRKDIAILKEEVAVHEKTTTMQEADIKAPQDEHRNMQCGEKQIDSSLSTRGVHIGKGLSGEQRTYASWRAMLLVHEEERTSIVNAMMFQCGILERTKQYFANFRVFS